MCNWTSSLRGGTAKRRQQSDENKNYIRSAENFMTSETAVATVFGPRPNIRVCMNIGSNKSPLWYCSWMYNIYTNNIYYVLSLLLFIKLASRVRNQDAGMHNAKIMFSDDDF